jgi:secreted PhoX family phosphatase
VTEAEATPKGDYKINKWYSMGRIAMELPLVMPDQQTVYLTDDGDNVGFFKFVADKKGDLNKGSLYAAKFKQQSAENGGKFTVTWILLGKGDQAVLKPLADKLTFYDIFNAGDVANCKAPFKLSNKGGKVECLQVKPGMENAAAFFETRRYAAYLGATTEWSKWEGVTYDPLRKKLYTAISENKNGMEDSMVKGKADGKFDDGNNNDIRLPYNQCGCVYSMDVDNQYSATTMDALICGTPKDSKSCDVNAIANPDNVSFMEGYGVLLIGEDSSYHDPNLLWAYDVANKKLKKLAEALPGAENTGTYFYDNIKGKQYIINVFQHPENGVHAEINFIGPLSLKKSEPVVFDTPYDEI